MFKINETKKENVGAGPVPAQRGITLIALIITIIVMLILVAVTITVAVNGGLFEYAGRAGKETQNEIEKEQTLANGKLEVNGKWYNSIDDYIAGKVLQPIYKEAKFENGLLTENARYISGDCTAIIPKGFAISNLKDEQTIEKGLVITDAVDEQGNSIGNEFVWIPVTYEVAEGSQKDANGLYPEFLAVFYRSNWVADDANGGKRGTTKYTATTSVSSYNEPYASGYSDGNGTEERKEYYEMMRSVQENKGFYIGRYEAGSTTARTDKANGTTEMVVKRDAYPYNYVGWGSSMSNYTEEITYSSKNQGKGALLLSKELYGKAEDAGKYGVVSTLCYGVQWDAMLDFVKDSTHNVTSSTSWGNYKENPWTITRTSAKYAVLSVTRDMFGDEYAELEDWVPIPGSGKEKTSDSSILLTTGASDSFAAKNIYDVAGNVNEITNEAFSFDYRIYRGGRYFELWDDSHPASDRYHGALCVDWIGFRPTLYITNK